MSNYQQQPPQPVTLKYEGAAQASFLTPASPITSKQYNVEGRGGYINVDARDVAWLLSFRSGPMAGFRQIDNAPVTNFNLTAAASQPGTVREAKPVPNLNDMTAKEAIAAIEDTDELSDLLVMKAMEQAKQPDMVRKTVIQAIEKRVDQLQRPAEEETLDASEQDG